MLPLGGGCDSDDASAQRLLDAKNENLHDIESFGVEFTYSDSAVVTMRLQAGHLVEVDELAEDGKHKGETTQYFDQGVEIYLLKPDGEPHTTIRSDSAIMSNDGDVRLVGNVFLQNRRDERMTTEELYWKRSVDSVYTTYPVRIETPDKVIVGRDGLRANTDFTGYTIYGIEGEIDAPEGIGD